MPIIDEKFHAKKAHYILQTLAAIVFMVLVLMALGTVGRHGLLGVVGASSLSATTFLVFAAPDTALTQPKHLLFSYMIAMIVGSYTHLAIEPLLVWATQMSQLSYEISAALAVGQAMFFMVLTDTEHPPAAGLALGVVIEVWDPVTLSVVLIAACALSIIKSVFARYLINLL